MVYVCSFRPAVFRFGHAETLLPVLSLLDLYNDTTRLTSQRFDEQRRRAFKTGKIAAFGANIMFVVYECDADDNDDVTTDDNSDNSDESDNVFADLSPYHVVLLHNEAPIHVPAGDECSENFLCPWSVFSARYASIVDQCNFNEICKADKRDEL